MRKGIAVIVAALVVLVAIIVAVVVGRSDGSSTVEVDPGLFEQPNPWAEQADPAAGVIAAAGPSITVGGVEVAMPQPAGTRLSWSHKEVGLRHVLSATGVLLEAPATFEWSAASGNPHTVFSGNAEVPFASLSKPVTSEIKLRDGELTYIDASLTRVPFAGEPVTISALSPGTITWRDGDDELTLWQWSADRVDLAASEDGGYLVRFHWWHPEQHFLPEQCAESTAPVTISPRVVISFAHVPDLAFGRLPGGVASAVVPIFIDPLDAEDPKFRDGAAPNAADLARRFRTIAMGHSSPEDARHGNGGLAGLEVGGTFVLPGKYADEEAAFSDLEATLGSTTIEILPEAELRPADCEAWVSKLSAGTPVLGPSHSFDGKFPNLVGPEQRSVVPGVGSWGSVWQATRLTGRRREVVTQALSATYLSRLAERRGVALLEIPVVASRNPLIPAAAEGLLDAERQGHWTIEESLARTLAEVELLAEDDRFDFVGLQHFDAHLRALRKVVIDQRSAAGWSVHNDGDQPVKGFTLVVDGLVSAMVDDQRVEQTTRTLGNGGEQTWIWWDLSPGATYELRLERPDTSASRAVSWTVPQ